MFGGILHIFVELPWRKIARFPWLNKAPVSPSLQLHSANVTAKRKDEALGSGVTSDGMVPALAGDGRWVTVIHNRFIDL